jgi:hypothetical protein
MADDNVPEPSDEEKLALPSLSLGFRRKRKRRGAAVEVPTEDTTDEPHVELGSEADEPDLVEPPDTTETQPIALEPAEGATEPAAEDLPVATVADEPDDTEPVPLAAATAAEPVTLDKPTAEAAPDTDTDTDPDLDDAEIGTMYPDHDETQVLPIQAADGPEDDSEDDGVNEPGDEDTSTGIDWGDEPAASEDPVVAAPSVAAPSVAAPSAPTASVPALSAPAADENPPERKRSLGLTGVDGRVAAVATGLVVGLTGVAVTYLFQRGCEAVKGTGSCGTIGLLLLVAVLVAMILAGGALLRVFKQSDSLSTSFLAVGLVAVIAMLFLLPVIDRWYMVVVIPLVAAGSYLLSWWVTSSFGDNAPVEREAVAPAERESADRS